jgi:hypothetical protein
MNKEQLELSTYQLALEELAEAYEKAEKLNDRELMLNISLSMEMLISKNDTNEYRIIQ